MEQTCCVERAAVSSSDRIVAVLWRWELYGSPEGQVSHVFFLVICFLTLVHLFSPLCLQLGIVLNSFLFFKKNNKIPFLLCWSNMLELEIQFQHVLQRKTTSPNLIFHRFYRRKTESRYQVINTRHNPESGSPEGWSLSDSSGFLEMWSRLELDLIHHEWSLVNCHITGNI